VHGLLKIDTPGAVLAADRNSAQKVHAIIERLKLAGHPARRIDRTMTRLEAME